MRPSLARKFGGVPAAILLLIATSAFGQDAVVANATAEAIEARLAREGRRTNGTGDKVVFGATVTLIDEDEKKVRYQLVGQVEADASHGRISYNSPLGRALIGRQKGEEVEVSTPSGDRYYEIKKIEFI